MTRWSKVLALALALAPMAVRAESVVNESWWTTYPMGFDAAAGRTRTGQIPMGVDASGNVFLMTGDGANVSMIKFNADGTPGWRHDEPIPEGYVELFGAGVDAQGVPYFAMTFGVVGQLVVRLDPETGDVATSTVVAPPPGYGSILGYDVKADAAGNIFTASEARLAGSGSDGFLVAKVDASGAVAWYGAWRPAYYSWSPRLGVDRQGNAVLHGDAWYGFATGWDPVGATVKFDGQSGAMLWTAMHYGLPNRGRQGVHLLAVGLDANDGIYLAGAQDTADSGANYLAQWPTIVRYDANGVFQWEAVDTGWKGTWFRSLVTDAAGAAYVTTGWDGSSAGSGGDCVVARYLPDGTRSWFVQYDGQESGDDGGCMLAADGVGGVYLAFTSSFVGRGGDATVLKLDPTTGGVLWRAFSGSTLLDGSRPAFGPQAVAANASGTLALYGKVGPDIGVLALGPAPTPAALVAPSAVSRLAFTGRGSAVVTAAITATKPGVVCNFTGGGTPFNSLNLKAGDPARTFLYRPQVAPTGYQATCYYDGPAGVGTVTATLNLRFDQGLNSKPVVVTFDGTATHQAVAVSLDATLAALKPSTTARVWVFDGVDSVDPDSGRITAYRWEVRDLKGVLVATLSGRGATYRFPSTAKYDVTLVVTDDDGRTGRVTTRVTP